MEEVLTRITEAIAKLSEKHGETAVATVLETASLMALHTLILSFIALIIGIILLWYVFFFKHSSMENECDILDNPLPFVSKFVSLIGGFIFFASSVTTITNPILWKSVSDPKFYVVYQILKKVK